MMRRGGGSRQVGHFCAPPLHWDKGTELRLRRASHLMQAAACHEREVNRQMNKTTRVYEYEYDIYSL